MSTYLRSVEKLVKSVKKVYDVSYVSFHKREDALVAKEHLEAAAPGCTVTMAKSSLAVGMEKEVLRAQDNRRLAELLEVVIPSQRLLIFGLPENKSMTALKNELGKVTGIKKKSILSFNTIKFYLRCYRWKCIILITFFKWKSERRLPRLVRWAWSCRYSHNNSRLSVGKILKRNDDS